MTPRWETAESKTGLLTVGAIIIVFILTATFLKAILFGLVLAYFFIPLQEWYLNRFLAYRPIIVMFKAAELIVSPLRRMRAAVEKAYCDRINTAAPTHAPSSVEKTKARRLQLSCALTVVTALAASLLAICAISVFSTSYAAKFAGNAWEWFDKNSQEEEATDGEITRADPRMPPGATTSPMERRSLVLLARMENELDKLTPNWNEQPAIKAAKELITETINKPENLKSFLHFLASKSGGIFSYTAGAIEKLISFLIGLALAFFSFAFFLHKMAAFNSAAGRDASAARHIVNGIFASGWFPKAGDSTREIVEEILGNILLRLRTWVRGYLCIIESIIYMVCFLLLGVPYWHLLGILAGMTILIPYLGPIASMFLTILVCLSFGETSSVQLILILSVYVIVHYLLEQYYFIPKYIGGSIGLNELETVIVVLLGGLLAGMPGLIFAVPATSVLKYLIPEVYGLMQSQKRQTVNDPNP